MILVVTHTGADFDALASLVAARKLYPGSRIAFLGTHEENIRQFLRDFGSYLNIRGSRGIDLPDITHLIVVETTSASRLGPFKSLFKKKSIEIHIYDHHVPQKNIHASHIVYKKVGAATTILTQILKERRIKFTPLEATLFVLGIYEDTGSLSFPSTTPLDRSAVQFLIRSGANLGLVTKYLSFSLTHDQIVILKDLVHSLETHYFDGIKVYIASAVSSKYVGDIAVLAHSLREMESLDAIFILVRMENRIQLVARSQTRSLDAGRVARLLGGGGHTSAASANIKKKNLDSARLKLISAIQSSIKIGRSRTRPIPPKKEKNILPLMERRLPHEFLNLFHRIGALADTLHMGTFLVGGFVRDLLLGVKDLDVDVAVEGDGVKFAKELSRHLNGKLHIHQKFKTAVVTNQDFKIDIATARTEYYERPGALPTVIPRSSIREDLSRRDFTVNALAIQLNKRHFGHLIDYYGGERALRRGTIEVLHNFSFIEDPTRIFRAVRFSSRYNFTISPKTSELIKRALKLELFESLSPERVRQELVAILNEENPLKAIKRMAEFNELAYIHPSIKYNRKFHNLLIRISSKITSHRKYFPAEDLRLWVIYLMAITHNLTPKELEEVLQKFTFSKRDRAKFLRSRKISSRLLKSLKNSLQPSRIYELLNPLSLEEIIFLEAHTELMVAQKNINLYLKKLRYVKIDITGEDLLRRGLRPGPVFGKILKRHLSAKLNSIPRTV